MADRCIDKVEQMNKCQDCSSLTFEMVNLKLQLGHTLKKKKKQPKATKKKLPEKSVLCSKDVLYHGTSYSLPCKSTYISKPVISKQFYLLKH